MHLRGNRHLDYGDSIIGAVDNPTLGSLACKGINKIYT